MGDLGCLGFGNGGLGEFEFRGVEMEFWEEGR